MKNKMKQVIRRRTPNLFFALSKIKSALNKIKFAAVQIGLQIGLHKFLNRGVRLQSYEIQKSHQQKLNTLHNISKIKVVFIVIHHATWKCDTLFRLMQEHNIFDPIIFIAEDSTNRFKSTSRAFLDSELISMIDYFGKRGFPVIIDRDSDSNFQGAVYATIGDVKPNLIIFNNPHDLAGQHLGTHLSEKYLSCYIPYHFEVTSYYNDQFQYNTRFHNSCWRIYAPHFLSKETYSKKQAIEGQNVLLSGHPMIDDIKYTNSINKNPWKKQDHTKLRVIWAPHQELEGGAVPRSCFLDMCDVFLSISRDFSDSVQWCFRPHPLLRANLENHSDWGSKKTDAYFQAWENADNSQVSAGNYLDLFEYSDAIIHDSYSFLIEYLLFDKPAMFLLRNQKQMKFLNQVGRRALEGHSLGGEEDEVRHFLSEVISGMDSTKRERGAFLDECLLINSSPGPSARIIRDLEEKMIIRPSDFVAQIS